MSRDEIIDICKIVERARVYLKVEETWDVEVGEDARPAYDWAVGDETDVQGGDGGGVD
jgi:hypothetical protein